MRGTPYPVGRPPFGYAVTSVKGVMAIDPDQAEDVKRVFYEAGRGLHPSVVAEILKSKHPDQNWDGKKVSRILEHRVLYQTGRYVNKAKGTDMVLPGLVILTPKEKQL